MRIQDLAQPAPVTVDRDTPVVDAALRMRRFHVGDVVVTEADGARKRPVGILTDRDIAIGIVGPAADVVGGLTCGDVLSTHELVTIDEDADLEEAVELIRAHGVRRLPVTDGNGRLLGIVTLDDLMQHYIGQLGKLADVVARQRAKETRERP
ncbi:MAG: CBS domain-containing protein [Alphaproteobacteria bacterium]|nr:CBS domain-containing protein [Myxococcales bacterium]MCB9675339.1 CBS domain-containing protein [Alphaproteobacteria bacterium]